MPSPGKGVTIWTKKRGTCMYVCTPKKAEQALEEEEEWLGGETRGGANNPTPIPRWREKKKKLSKGRRAGDRKEVCMHLCVYAMHRAAPRVPA